MAPSHLMSNAGRATVHGWDWGARMGIKPLGGSFERPPKPNPDIGTCLTFFHIGRLRAKTRQDLHLHLQGEVFITHYAAYSKLRILRVFCVFTQCPWGALRIAYCVMRMWWCREESTVGAIAYCVLRMV